MLEKSAGSESYLQLNVNKDYYMSVDSQEAIVTPWNRISFTS